MFSLILLFPFIAQASVKPLIFYGDNQGSIVNHRKLVEEITEQDPGVVFNVGDLVSYKYDVADWANFNSIIAPLKEIAPYYPAIGNHDAYSGYFTQSFPDLPRGGRYYAKIYSRLYIIVLDSNADFSRDYYQKRWFVRQLSRARELKKTIIVVFHHPPVSSDGGEENTQKLLPLIKMYHVRMVFSGHYHHYERSYFQGTQFIVTGGGGATLYPRTQIGPYSRTYAKLYHFCRLDLEDFKMHFRVYDINLNLVEDIELSYTKY